MQGPPELGQQQTLDRQEQLLAAVRHVVDPELGASLVELGMVRSLSEDSAGVHVELALTIAACPLRSQLKGDVERALGLVEGVRRVEVRTVVMEREERAALMAKARRLAQERPSGIELAASTRVLGIVSGKGGVGKSSVTVNLALSLAQSGLRVGLLDADIWGFSIPRMLGLEAELQARNGKMVPIEYGVGGGVVRVVSMGFLSSEEEAIMWRGLMLNRAVQHFLEDVAWGDLDYLLVDMPPGTGDVQMGLARMLPRTELLVVTTPNLAAQKVAGRAADMARKGNLRVAGVIENMSGFTCAHGEHYELFGSGGGSRLSQQVGAPLVGAIPLDPSLAAGSDEGKPVALDPQSPLHEVFCELARKVREEIAPLQTMEACSARLLAHVESALSQAAPRAAEL